VARAGMNLSVYGTIGEIQEDATLLCIGTEGRWEGRRFEIIGRLQNMIDEGTWNEWHIAFDNGSFGWLAEAQGFFSVQLASDAPAPARYSLSFEPGQEIELAYRTYVVKQSATARCIAGEGSLPFAVGEGYELPFVDLVSRSTHCATIDFSDEQARLYCGEYVDFEALELKGLREELPADHPMARVGDAAVEKIACPSCGGGLERQTGKQSSAIYCQYCGSGIDLTKAPYTLFAKQSWHGLAESIAPLGSKATFEGAEFTLLAAVVREAVRWHVSWTEHLLYNPRLGYRWLINADGHFTWFTPLYEWPDDSQKVSARGHAVSYVESNEVAVRKVAGELYWRVQIGDVVHAVDYANAPYTLSQETSGNEVSWSLGEYMDGKQVWKAFGLEGSPPMRIGMLPHQPAPSDKYLKPMAIRWAAAVAILVIASIAYHASNKSVIVSTSEHKMQVARSGAQAGDALLDGNTVWIGPFKVPSGPTALEIRIDATVSNSWMYLRMGLYNETKAESMDFGQEISRYSGPDWSEGSPTEKVIVPKIEAGTYYLRIEPTGGDFKARQEAKYTVTIRRDVPLMRWPMLAFVIITLPMAFVAISKMRFETRRREETS